MSEIKLTRRLDLERMIDADGLPQILEEISLLCLEKADHIETNWQDAQLAQGWRAASKLIQNLLTKFPL